MAGQLTIDTLKASSGVLATQNGMTGIPKAWVSYNSVAQTISASFNVSSVTYNSSGNVTVTMTTAMSSASYSVLASVGGGNGGRNVVINPNTTSAGNTYTQTTTTFMLNNYSGGQVNDEYVNAAVFGS